MIIDEIHYSGTGYGTAAAFCAADLTDHLSVLCQVQIFSAASVSGCHSLTVPDAGKIVCEADGASTAGHALKLPAVLPAHAPVRAGSPPVCRVADAVIADAVTVVGSKLVIPSAVAIGIAVAAVVLYVMTSPFAMVLPAVSRIAGYTPPFPCIVEKCIFCVFVHAEKV